MIEISINKINKNYGFNPVLKDFSIEIKSGQRIALIGNNGCGKTTTLRLIMGLETVDSGTINIRKGSKLGYLTQIPPMERENICKPRIHKTYKGLSRFNRKKAPISKWAKDTNRCFTQLETLVTITT